MLADPTITVSGSAKSLKRTGMSDNSGTFSESNGDYKLLVKHSYGKRNRHAVSLVNTKVTPDPLTSGSSFLASMTTSFAADVPPVGYTVAEMAAQVAALGAYLTASSAAIATQILGGES